MESLFPLSILGSLIKNITWPYMLGFISVLTILLHWSMCQFLCHFHVLLMTSFILEFVNRKYEDPCLSTIFTNTNIDNFLAKTETIPKALNLLFLLHNLKKKCWVKNHLPLGNIHYAPKSQVNFSQIKPLRIWLKGNYQFWFNILQASAVKQNKLYLSIKAEHCFYFLFVHVCFGYIRF